MAAILDGQFSKKSTNKMRKFYVKTILIELISLFLKT